MERVYRPDLARDIMSQGRLSIKAFLQHANQVAEALNLRVPSGEHSSLMLILTVECCADR
jgi:hypothetical protein